MPRSPEDQYREKSPQNWDPANMRAKGNGRFSRRCPLFAPVCDFMGRDRESTHREDWAPTLGKETPFVEGRPFELALSSSSSPNCPLLAPDSEAQKDKQVERTGVVNAPVRSLLPAVRAVEGVPQGRS